MKEKRAKRLPRRGKRPLKRRKRKKLNQKIH